MAAIATETGFVVWGIDQTAYGPVELPGLVAWVKDERVKADTWIYAAKNGSWQKAADVPELQMFFRAKSGAASEGAPLFARKNICSSGTSAAFCHEPFFAA